MSAALYIRGPVMTLSVRGPVSPRPCSSAALSRPSLTRPCQSAAQYICGPVTTLSVRGPVSPRPCISAALS
ncbi:hypothetical protein RHGRI_032006 [Rhododendron griersonianum]|uniref:Uncharacterized protein n=1 Tax=Rhododendron griersonianum TaxID=479676 RepID=A0AAV6IEV5_9ERIC|nr:hypothetical protein RHGRI_032006 [Rhododendron griersonianum]